MLFENEIAAFLRDFHCGLRGHLEHSPVRRDPANQMAEGLKPVSCARWEWLDTAIIATIWVFYVAWWCFDEPPRMLWRWMKSFRTLSRVETSASEELLQ